MVPITDDLSEREKTLLTLLGKNPDIPHKTLLEATGYHCGATISKKKRELIKKGYIRGPYYHINLNAVGENELFDVYADIHFDVSHYNLVFNLIKAIKCWRWIFPAMEGDRLFAYFQCNYYTQIARLLNLLKKEGLITYHFYSSQNRWIGENPNFFGEEIISFDNIFSECRLPCIEYPPRKTGRLWKLLDIRVMGYLQVKSADIKSICSYEREIYGYSWKRSQVKYTIQKLIDHGIAERKHFNVSPYPRDACFSFLLFLMAGDQVKTLQTTKNLGNNCRIYKAYTLAGDTSIMLGWAHVLNMPNFLSAFEDTDVEVKAYQLKAHKTQYMTRQSFDVENFDLETQRWIFPYSEYQENIEKLLSEERY